MKFSLVLGIVLSFVAADAAAQKQLLLLKDQDVILRLKAGDEIVFKVRDDPSVKRTYINNLFRQSLKTHRDTIDFTRIERLYFRQTSFANRMGQRLVILGAGLFIIDQVNVSLIQGQPFSVDSRISRITLAALGAGLPLMLLRKKSQKISGRYRLMTVEKGSPFYREEAAGLQKSGSR